MLFILGIHNWKRTNKQTSFKFLRLGNSIETLYSEYRASGEGPVPKVSAEKSYSSFNSR